MENLVFTELIKAGSEIYYFKSDFECDFVIKTVHGLEGIQVCYELNDQNKKREFGRLQKLSKQFNLEKQTIITYNQEEVAGHISVIPFWKYFTNFNR